MENRAPSFGDQIARLHGTMQAQEKCAWIPTAIHTLIMAALARIFGRLEQLLHLWQSNTLPLPATTRPPQPARQPAPRPTSVHSHPRARTASPRPESATPAPRRTPTKPAANPPPARTFTPGPARPPAKNFSTPPWTSHPATP